MTSAPTKRIIHVTVYNELATSIRKQITWEQKAAKLLKDVEWTQLALHCGEPKEPFERRIPAPFRTVLLRSLYAWIIVWRLCRTYDFVLLRHMPFDPFVFFFAPLLSNRISLHHSKEAEELLMIRPGTQGRLASFLEYISGKVAVRTARAILGVTPEIAAYQVESRAPGKPYFVYANGVDFDSVEILADNRDSVKIEMAFICSFFSEWHGLDLLIDEVRKMEVPSDSLVIHLIGHLYDDQKFQIESLGAGSECFRKHGYLDSEDYRSLLSHCDIGLGSFALERKKLAQATTLKVREMLAMGLPVYSGHEDSSLPEGFPYYVNRNVNIADICEYAISMKQHTRPQVRQAAGPFISKLSSMQKVVDWLNTL